MKKKNFKKISKRALALFIAVVMVAGTPQLVSLADDIEDTEGIDELRDNGSDNESGSDSDNNSDDESGSDSDSSSGGETKEWSEDVSVNGDSVDVSGTYSENQNGDISFEGTGKAGENDDVTVTVTGNKEVFHPGDPEVTEVIDATKDPTDNTTNGSIEGSTDNTSGENTTEGSSDNTSGNTTEGSSDNTSGENTTEGSSDNTSGENTTEGSSDSTSGENTTEGSTDNISAENTTEGSASVSSEGTAEDSEIPKDNSVTVNVEPGQGEKSTEFGIDPDIIAPKPEVPEGYKKSDDGSDVYTKTEPIENGSINHTWKFEESTGENGEIIYVTKTSETTKTEVTVENEPDNKPAHAVDIEGGYQFTDVETLEDGTVQTTVTTVINGTTTITTEKIITTETRVEISNGVVTVQMFKVTPGTDQKREVSSYKAISPSVKEEYNNVGYDKKNDLYDREGFESLAIAETTARLNVRNKPTTKGSTIYTTLSKGSKFYIYEEKDGWYRIGQNAWVSKEGLTKIDSGTYVVKVNDGFVYSDTIVTEKAPASRANGAIVRVDKIKTVNGVRWAHINSDGNGGGWIQMSKLRSATPQEQKQDLTYSDPKYLKFDDVDKDGNIIEKYDYFFLGEQGLESSIRVSTENGSNTWMAHQFILRDRESGKTYVYCAELGNDAKADYRYKMIPIDMETADDTMKMLNLIALNGYWGVKDEQDADGNFSTGSLEAFKTSLEAYLKSQNKDASEINDILKEITPGLAITATQAAFWVYAHDEGHVVNTTNFNKWIKYYGNYFNITDNKVEETYDRLSEKEREALKTACLWLTGLTSETPGANTVPEAITKDNFATSASVTVTKYDDISKAYEADVAIAMEVTPSKLNDDLILTIISGQYETRVRLAGEEAVIQPINGKTQNGMLFLEPDENGVYTIRGVKLENGSEITIRLSGTQNLGKGVYIFSSEQKDNATSQRFIGLSDSDVIQHVDLNVTLSFNATEATATTTVIETNSFNSRTNSKQGYSTRHTTTEPREGDDDADADDDSDADADADADSDADVPDEPTPLTNIPTVPVPLANVPVEDTLTEIVDEDVPLAGLPSRRGSLVDIFDEDVPLANVPKTGDISDTWYLIAALSAAGLLCLAAWDRKKRKSA